MSDNEVQNTEKHLETASSSADESSASEAAKMSQVSEEPRRQRQDSSSSSSSSESESEAAEPQVESEDESSVSKSVSKSESANEASVSSESAAGAEPQPPQPRSRSVSVEEAVSPPAPAERKKSSASEKFEADIAEDTDEDVEKEDLEEPMVQPVAQPPPPVVIEPVEAEEPEAEPEVEEPEEPVPVPRKASLDNELTQDEVELSKRETVHLDEAEKAEVLAEVSRKSSTDSSASSASEEEMMETKSPVEAMPAAIIEEEPVNGQNGHMNGRNGLKVEEAISSSDEDEAIKPTASPLNGRRSAGTGAVTKIYTNAIDNNNKTCNNNNIDKREKPTRDITQIYTQTLAKSDTPPASPKSAPRSRPANDITKLYTGKLDARARTPEPEKLAPKKHNMSTAVDKDAIRGAYDDVRSDTTDTEWAVFKFDQNNRLGVTAKGKDFPDFKAHFGNDDRGFGYIRIKTGDEMSKRAKFVMVTWIGPGVSVMKKAKMSTDKALMKDICQNMSVELQLETHGEFSHDNFKLQVDKASGARYGTGVRDL